MFSFRNVSYTAAVLSFLLIPTANSSVVISGTRVIYPANKKEVTVKIINENANPVLIQSWIDHGNDKEAPENISVPFVITPPINRIETKKGQTLRISSLGGQDLPKDKESVFWLNVLEIAARNKEEVESSKLNVAFRSRIKLFYRPVGLSGNANQAPALLQWRLDNGGVKVKNPTVYHVSMVSLNYNNIEIKTTMLAPGEEKSYHFDNVVVSNLNSISFSTINDYGGLVVSKIN